MIISQQIKACLEQAGGAKTFRVRQQKFPLRTFDKPWVRYS